MDCVLGVDAGNSKTLALAARFDGRIVGTARTGCGDIYAYQDPLEGTRTIQNAAHDALQQAGPQHGRAIAAVYSAAGADWPEDIELLSTELRGTARAVRVVNDGFGALRAASPANTGVAIVCGTYTATAARAEDGTTWHAGFWQEPSGARELGRLALHAVYRADLGIGPPTRLSAAVLTTLGMHRIDEVVHHLSARRTAATRPDLAALAKPLLTAAEEGDPVAQDLVHRHGEMLGAYGVAAARRVRLRAPAHDLVLAGGVFRHPGVTLPDAALTRYRQAYPHARVRRPRLEPVYGAVMLALEAAGVTVTPEVEARLGESGPGEDFFAT